MQPDQFRPFVKSVGDILEAMKTKERYIEELNTTDLPEASQTIRNKLQTFESLLKSAKVVSDQNSKLTDEQDMILQKVVDDTNRAIEADNLKALEISMKDLESFSQRIAST
jgi:hypothetical protein